MPKGRKAVVVSEKALRELIAEIEEKEEFNSQLALFSRVATEYEAKFQVRITPSVVYLRIKQFNIPLKTQKAKRTIGKELRIIAKVKENVDETNVEPIVKQTISQLLSYFDKKEKIKYEKLAKNVLRGSRKAAIKLNCLGCCGGSMKEIKECQINTCPLWLFRPYK